MDKGVADSSANHPSKESFRKVYEHSDANNSADNVAFINSQTAKVVDPSKSKITAAADEETEINSKKSESCKTLVSAEHRKAGAVGHEVIL